LEEGARGCDLASLIGEIMTAIKNTAQSNVGNLVIIKKHGRGATAHYEVRYTPDRNIQSVWTKTYTDAIGTRADNIRRIQFHLNKGLPADLTRLVI
jgi:hypothetical protein